MAGSATSLSQSADEQFKQWLASRSGGFYLNYKWKQAWMLHKADCWHFGSGAGVKATTNSKVCSEDVKELEKWANDNNVAIMDCPDCRPKQVR